MPPRRNHQREIGDVMLEDLQREIHQLYQRLTRLEQRKVERQQGIQQKRRSHHPTTLNDKEDNSPTVPDPGPLWSSEPIWNSEPKWDGEPNWDDNPIQLPHQSQNDLEQDSHRSLMEEDGIYEKDLKPEDIVPDEDAQHEYEDGNLEQRTKEKPIDPPLEINIPLQSPLGRPWQFDRETIHTGKTNTYSFMDNGQKVVLLTSLQGTELGQLKSALAENIKQRVVFAETDKPNTAGAEFGQSKAVRADPAESGPPKTAWADPVKPKTALKTLLISYADCLQGLQGSNTGLLLLILESNEEMKNLPSKVLSLVQADLDRFVDDGSLDDNVESSLSHDDTNLRNAIGIGKDVSVLQHAMEKDLDSAAWFDVPSEAENAVCEKGGTMRPPPWPSWRSESSL